MSYENFYEGSSSSLEEKYGDLFVGYKVYAGSIGATTSVQTANQIREVTNLLNQGITNVEVSTVSAEAFEMIPKQHLKEINRLSQLTGTELSLHAPLIEPSGFTQQGWSDENREMAERQLKEVIERSHELSPHGNIPVTIHSSAVPGTEHIKDPETGKDIPQTMVAVNQETGQFIPLTREEKFYPGKLKKTDKGYEGKISTPKKELEIQNVSYWDNKLSNLVFYKEGADRLMKGKEQILSGIFKKIDDEGNFNVRTLTPTQIEALNDYRNAQVYLSNTEQSLNSLFNQAFKVGNNKVKEQLVEEAKIYESELEQYKKEKNPKILSNAMQNMITKLHNITTAEGLIPELFIPVENFTKQKASETLSNVALHGYHKFKGDAPIISIENPPYGAALSTAEDLKDLVKKTRDKFVEKAAAEGMSKTKAKEIAEKLIGVTWDTSHISMIRKQGYGPEKLVQQAKEIAPYVKHVHLNDNFGTTHTDLPPGMGSVPIKEILGELEKAGYKGKKVFEGGAFFQHFQRSPHPYILEALGSPLYAMGASPTWSEIANTYGNYAPSYGIMFPEQHFSIYGSGFSNLPAELGGQVGDTRSRTTGTPMA